MSNQLSLNQQRLEAKFKKMFNGSPLLRKITSQIVYDELCTQYRKDVSYTKIDGAFFDEFLPSNLKAAGFNVTINQASVIISW